MPPSDEGGVRQSLTEGEIRGRDKRDKRESLNFSLPQSRKARQLPRQREPIISLMPPSSEGADESSTQEVSNKGKQNEGI